MLIYYPNLVILIISDIFHLLFILTFFLIHQFLTIIGLLIFIFSLIFPFNPKVINLYHSTPL